MTKKRRQRDKGVVNRFRNLSRDYSSVALYISSTDAVYAYRVYAWVIGRDKKMSLITPSWQCQSCSRYNSHEREVCRICGEPRKRIITPESTRAEGKDTKHGNS